MKKIAALGPEETYSDVVAKMYSNEMMLDIVYYPTILKVYLGLEECDYALLPFENTLDGFVMEALDLIINNGVYIIDQKSLEIDFSFVSNYDINSITTIYAHNKAKGQCINFISKYYFNTIDANSNIAALQ